MQYKKGQIIDLKIDSVASLGQGIGEYEGMKVFVDGTVGGDRVKAAFTRIKKNYAEAELKEIKTASADRINPVCPHFEKCGGCQFQYLAYDKQVEMKKTYVIDALERIGGIKNPPVCEVKKMEEPFNYRNKMEYSFGYDSDMNYALGFHVPKRRYDIVDIESCALQPVFFNEILNAVKRFSSEKNWLPYRYSVNEGFMRSLYIREGLNTGQVMVNIVTDEDLPDNFNEEIRELAGILKKLKDDRRKTVSIYHSVRISRRGMPKRITENLLFGEKSFFEKMTLRNGDSLKFEILPQAFFQVNTKQAEVLYSEVIEMAAEKTHGVIYDLYCGTGTIGLFLAKYADQVYGIEISPEAIQAARENAKINNIFNMDFLAGDTTKMLKNVRELPSLIVVDPPRAGLNEKIIRKINHLSPKSIIYVSCNPASLARDTKMLMEFGFRLKKVKPVDMFPQTYHIETVSLLERQ